MTAQQLEVRKRRAQQAPLVIQRTDEGFRVYSACEPSRTYLVTDDGDRINCTCPDFRAHNADPEWRCKHILAVQEMQRRPRQTEPEPDAEPPEELPTEQPEAEPAASRSSRSRKRRENRNGNGTGAAQMLIKRSVSPDGRIDSVSVEFSTEVNGAPVAEIKARALRTLKLQNEIASAFLKLNGNGGHPSRSEPETGPAPAAQVTVNGNAVPARLIDVGSANGRFGPRLFITVNVNGKRLRLYGSAKQLAAYIGYAGEQVNAEELEPGLRLNLPCRVILTENDNGFLTVSKVFRAGLPPQKGRRQWSAQQH